jgi:hypothetical protein
MSPVGSAPPVPAFSTATAFVAAQGSPGAGLAAVAGAEPGVALEISTNLADVADQMQGVLVDILA